MCRSRRGVILALTLLVTGSLVFLGTLFLDLYRATGQESQLIVDRIVARHAADAGIADARLALQSDPSWSAGFRQELSNGATCTVTFAPGGAPWSTSNSAGNATVTGWDGRPVPAGMVHVVCVGVYGRSTVLRQGLLARDASTDEVTFKYRW